MPGSSSSTAPRTAPVVTAGSVQAARRASLPASTPSRLLAAPKSDARAARASAESPLLLTASAATDRFPAALGGGET